ncbi:alpha-amylase [Endozoicomonas gorgoniicola]|uniref:Alpha-amylase n=1 Tax=Endozoicomonas gorgoniicola TaxID=1234144 RepID=A0ABT3MTF8_9GAMM|nr:alpha-amylase [Endozoicomonas gorgoniicola]MCW7552642.1 alpha-amylase [Endozoicomonas gorgoniicola]
MSKDNIKPEDNAANMQNANRGSSGTNRQYDQNQGNRGKQLNPNQKKK